MSSKLKKTALVGALCVAIAYVVLLFAIPALSQTPEPAPPPLTIWERLDAAIRGLAAGGSIAGIAIVFGVVARFIPAINNKVIPALVGVTLIVGDVLLVLGKFLEALGITPPQVGLVMDGPAFAGLWGTLAGVLGTGLAVAFGGAQGAFTRWVWEKYLRHALPPPASPHPGPPGF